MEGPIGLLILAVFGSVLALIGGVVFLFNKRLSGWLETVSAPFASGVLITVAILGLVPEALEHGGENMLLVLLLAFFGSYLFEYLLFGIHHHGDSHHHHHALKSSVPLVIIGDTIHNFIDGVAIGVSFLIDPGLGFVTALSSFLHEVPHEISDFGILLKAGWSRNAVLIVNVLSASLTIVGAFLVYWLPVGDGVIGALLAMSAGIFLYLGASDFLPEIEHVEGNKLRVILPLIIGVVLMVAIIQLVPHAE